MNQNYTIIAFTENKPGVLYRIADLFLRRRINIESLTVSEIETPGTSRFTIVVNTERDMVEKISKQLYRIIEVIKVVDYADEEMVIEEVALYRVAANSPEKRQEINDIVSLTQSKVSYFTKNEVILTKVGTEKEIDNVRGMLKPYGIREFVRSGRIAIKNTNI